MVLTDRRQLFLNKTKIFLSCHNKYIFLRKQMRHSFKGKLQHGHAQIEQVKELLGFPGATIRPQAVTHTSTQDNAKIIII